jgi:hypothetical protein
VILPGRKNQIIFLIINYFKLTPLLLTRSSGNQTEEFSRRPAYRQAGYADLQEYYDPDLRRSARSVGNRK